MTEMIDKLPWVPGSDRRRLKSGGESIIVAGDDRRRGCVGTGGQVVIIGVADPTLHHPEDRGQLVQEMPAEHGGDPSRGHCRHDLSRYAARADQAGYPHIRVGDDPQQSSQHSARTTVG